MWPMWTLLAVAICHAMRWAAVASHVGVGCCTLALPMGVLTWASCRHLADDLRGSMARPSAFAQPEWKEKALGKAVMFGFQDSRPIKEQRMGLPIFPFREQILQGVKDNQIIICDSRRGCSVRPIGCELHGR